MATDTQRYDWIFIGVMGFALFTYVAIVSQSVAPQYTAILGSLQFVAGFFSNVAAARMDTRNDRYAKGLNNPWLVGIVSAAVLYTVLNLIITIVTVSLHSTEIEFGARQLSFVSDRYHFEEFVTFAASTEASLLMSIVSIVVGAAIVSRSRNHLVSTLTATLGYAGLSVLVRLLSFLAGNRKQLRMFADYGWTDVIVGLMMNISVVSFMIWCGVLLVRGRRG